MRQSLCFAIALCLFGMAGMAVAQRQPDFDPSYIPFNLKPKRLDACNVTIGADRAWEFQQNRSRGADGQTITSYKAQMNSDFWRRHLGLQSRLTVSPYASINLACNAAGLSEGGKVDGLAHFANGLHTAQAKAKGYNVSALRNYAAPGLGTVWYFTALRKGTGKRRGAISDMAFVMTLHRGQLVTARIDLFRTPPSNFRKRHPAGKEHQVTLVTAQTIHGKNQ